MESSEMFRRVIPPCSRYVVLSLLLLSGSPSKAQAPAASEDAIHLPSSKNLILPIPGDPHVAGGFPTTVALHPSGRYVALLDGGYGMHESDLRQGIAVLDLQTNRVTHSADPRLGFRAQQTYFLGLSFDRSGEHLFASIASITDPLGKMRGNTGNGIAVYTFARGTVKPERFSADPADSRQLNRILWQDAKGSRPEPQSGEPATPARPKTPH
jgi:hypothetical protein